MMSSLTRHETVPMQQISDYVDQRNQADQSANALSKGASRLTYRDRFCLDHLPPC